MIRTTARRRRAGLLALPAAVVLAAPVLLAACGGSSVGVTPSASGATSSAATTSTVRPAGFPVTVIGANGPLTLKAAPTHIVSMSPTATEMLFAIGAGAQVEAADSNSNYPSNAPTTKLSAYQPNAEAVAAYKPDLVVISNDANGLLAALRKLAIPALVLPAAATLDDSYAQLDTLGKATGHGDDAAKVVTQTEQRIAAAVASVPASSKGLKVYHELDQTYYSVTSKTFIGGIYAMFGLKNIADAAKGASSGYPQLSAEYVVTSSPDLIVLADTKCCQQSAAAVAKRPAFAAVLAVKTGKVLALDDDVASRWGPRIADFATSIAKALGGS
jgi:iron complex transport system substrate-binding protein